MLMLHFALRRASPRLFRFSFFPPPSAFFALASDNERIASHISIMLFTAIISFSWPRHYYCQRRHAHNIYAIDADD